MTHPVLDRIKQNNFQALAGTRLYCKIPLTRAFLNWNIQQSLPDSIKSLHIRSIQGRQIIVHLETNIPLLPVFEITVELYESLHPPQLALKMKIVDGLGWVARSVADKFLPDGIDLDDKVLTVDLYHFLLKNKEYSKMANQITVARWIGAKDKLFLELELQV